MSISNDAVLVLLAVRCIIEIGVFYYCKVRLLSIGGLKSQCSLSAPRTSVGHLFRAVLFGHPPIARCTPPQIRFGACLNKLEYHVRLTYLHLHREIEHHPPDSPYYYRYGSQRRAYSKLRLGRGRNQRPQYPSKVARLCDNYKAIQKGQTDSADCTQAMAHMRPRKTLYTRSAQSLYCL
jgi:hypothetical protein